MIDKPSPLPDFSNGLVPAVIQDDRTREVLMLGYMDAEAFRITLETGKVTFFSRSKQRLWTKGESSGNFLNLQQWHLDCDADTLLIQVIPDGPVCHTGQDTCFARPNQGAYFLDMLESIIHQRKLGEFPNSYTASLFAEGINKVAQKVGEEAVELIIEAKDERPDLFLNEAADLLYHYLVLLAAKDVSLAAVTEILAQRHQNKHSSK